MMQGGFWLWTLLIGLMGLIISLCLTPLIRIWAIRKNLLDRAEQFHTTHTIAVPRLGGVSLVVAFVAILLVIVTMEPSSKAMGPGDIWILFWSCLGMFALGFWDDLKPLGAKKKLLIQILIAVLVYANGLRISSWVNPLTHTQHLLGILDAPLTIIWIVSVTNLINLVGGIDSLAGGLAFLMMLLLGILGCLAGNIFMLFLCLGMAGAILGFLYYNFPPAKIFMGDGGAYFLGALIAEMALINSNKGEVAVALIAPFLALGLPIIDASYTIFRRGLVGLPIFRADRKHLHHKLFGMGLSKQRVVLLLYAFCVFFSLLALGVLVSQGRLLPVIFGIFMVMMVLSARIFGFFQSWYKLGRLLTAAVMRRKHTRYALLLGEVFLIEAERCGTVDELWEQFGFVLRKLRFDTVMLNDGERQWRWIGKVASGKTVYRGTQDVHGTMHGELVLTCDTSQMDEETFYLLSELVAESWSKATRRLSKSNVHS